MRLTPLVLAVLCGCTGTDNAPGVAGTCFDYQGNSYGPCRVFRGRLKLPPADQLHTGQGSFQLAAVGFVSTDAPPAAADGSAASATDGSVAAADAAGTTPPTAAATPRLFFGPVFAYDAGAGQRPDTPFSIVVPCAQSVNLVLQVPRTSGGDAPGFWVAAMRFATDDGGSTLTTLVPRQAADLCGSKTNALDLGQVTLTLRSEGLLGSGEITLGKDNSKNPLELLDSDGDGAADLADTDDDDDGQPDIGDPDAQGDAVADTAQTLSALPDQDADGIPDLFE